MKIASVGILGAGAWGTALANVARINGHATVLWAYEPDVIRAINGERRNPIYLPDVPVAPGIEATADLNHPARCDIVLLATPAQHLRAIVGRLVGALPAGAPLVICAKGIVERSH